MNFSTAQHEHEHADVNVDVNPGGSLVQPTYFPRSNERNDDSVILRRLQFLHIPQHRNGSRMNIPRCFVGSLLILCIVYVIFDFCGDRNIESVLIDFLEWTHEHPYRGVAAVVLCYIVATVFFVPGSILTFGAGFAIGSAFDNIYLGTLVAMISVFIGASIGSICSFMLGRYLFRDCVVRLAISYPVFQAMERALETNGLKIMVLLRLSPLIPFNALDYISGITSITLRDYAIALVAILPGAFVLCFAGASASSLSDRTSTNSNNTIKVITIISGILFGGGGVYLASYYSRVELDRILNSQFEHNLTGYSTSRLSQDEADEIIIETFNDGDNGDSTVNSSTELVMGMNHNMN